MKDTSTAKHCIKVFTMEGILRYLVHSHTAPLSLICASDSQLVQIECTGMWPVGWDHDEQGYPDLCFQQKSEDKWKGWWNFFLLWTSNWRQWNTDEIATPLSRKLQINLTDCFWGLRFQTKHQCLNFILPSQQKVSRSHSLRSCHYCRSLLTDSSKMHETQVLFSKSIMNYATKINDKN